MSTRYLLFWGALFTLLSAGMLVDQRHRDREKQARSVTRITKEMAEQVHRMKRACIFDEDLARCLDEIDTMAFLVDEIEEAST